ncbi:MAG TPA: enoyl-CoA hydratase-related protein, partial [Ignavibacteriaceae bacterium]|nr:enoyl-CoA hydratase-related protein [Ignavibacteriaceae bacterium]
MDYKNLLLNVNQNIGLITINRPDKLNALNRETLTELKVVLEKLRSDENIFVVIITGSGEK